MKPNVKNVLAVSVGAFLAAAAAMTVYAYLQSEPERQNEFNIQRDNVTISEEFSEPDTVSMSNEFTKKVQVSNTGAIDQFVRVYMDFSDSTVRDKSLIIVNNTEYEWSAFLGQLKDEPPNPSNTKDWVYVSETDTDGADLGGYFYYTKVLSAGQTTPALIEGVKTKFGDDGNTDKITDFDIIVYTETVQTTEIDANGTVYGDGEWRQAWKSFLNVT